MGRPATGSVKWNEAKGYWEVRITLPSGERRPVPMPGIPREAEARAKATGKAVSLRAREVGAVPVEGSETVREYSERWLADRAARKLTTVTDDRSRLEHHVLPKIGALPMASVTRAHLKQVVADLDARVRGPERFSWKTAGHVWGNVSRLFADAVDSKEPSLCVLDVNPASGVRGPERGREKRKQYLWPREAVTLMACESLPLWWRRLFAVSTYLYLRPEEAEALEWRDVDLEHGIVFVSRAVERVRSRGVRGAEKPVKSEAGVREVPIDPALLPLLKAMHGEASGCGRVVLRAPSEADATRMLRRYMRIAGVDREALFVDDAASQALTWYHATRSAGITWEAMRGIDSLRLMRRAGHEDLSTTLKYVRVAEDLRGRGGEPFPDVPSALLEGAESSGRVTAVLARNRAQTPNEKRAPQESNL